MDTILDPAALAAESSAAAPDAPAPLVTLVTTDRRIIAVTPKDGGLTLTVDGRGNTLHLDQYQALALSEALADHVGVL